VRKHQSLQFSWIQKSYWQCSLTELQYSHSLHSHHSHHCQKFQSHFSRYRLCASCICSSEAQREFEDHQHSCVLFYLCLCISSQALELQTDESNRLDDVCFHRENILEINDVINHCWSLKSICNDDWFCVCSALNQYACVRFFAWLIAQSLLFSIVLSFCHDSSLVRLSLLALSDLFSLRHLD